MVGYETKKYFYGVFNDFIESVVNSSYEDWVRCGCGTRSDYEKMIKVVKRLGCQDKILMCYGVWWQYDFSSSKMQEYVLKQFIHKDMSPGMLAFLLQKAKRNVFSSESVAERERFMKLFVGAITDWVTQFTVALDRWLHDTEKVLDVVGVMSLGKWGNVSHALGYKGDFQGWKKLIVVDGGGPFARVPKLSHLLSGDEVFQFYNDFNLWRHTYFPENSGVKYSVKYWDALAEVSLLKKGIVASGWMIHGYYEKILKKNHVNHGVVNALHDYVASEEGYRVIMSYY
jgi:hypothetical protein